MARLLYENEHRVSSPRRRMLTGVWTITLIT